MPTRIGGSGNVRNSIPSHNRAATGAGISPVDYGTYQLDALRKAADNPAHVPAAGVSGDVPPPSTDERARLQWAAEQLEALLLHELLKTMRSTIDKADLFDGPGVALFEEMLDEERSKEMAAGGGLGLAQLIYEQMAPDVLLSPDALPADASRTTAPVGEEKPDKDA